MAQLFPNDFDLTGIEYSEERAIKMLIASLDDSWIIIPNVSILVNRQDSEIDIILVSFDIGVYLIEVKGGAITIDKGQWKSNGTKIQDPIAQIRSAKHSLISRLRKQRFDLTGFFMQHVVAFPDIVDFPADGAGPDCPRKIVLTQADLKNPIPTMSALSDESTVVPKDSLKLFLKALRPDVLEIEVDGSLVRGVSQRISKATYDSLIPIIELDENLRVNIRGAAGTGKTFLCKQWAKRSLKRNESTLLVCYNKILGSELASRKEDMVKHVENPPLFQVGSFHDVVVNLLGDLTPKVPENAGQEFWNIGHAQALIANIQKISVRFKTIIIDEGQDFHPLWLKALEGLLDDPASDKILMASDQKQAIYVESWAPPADWTTLELKRNLRNTKAISAAVQKLGGAPAREHAPIGPSIKFYTAGGRKEARKRIAEAIHFAMTTLDVPLSQIAVLVAHREIRNWLCENGAQVEGTAEFALKVWQERDEDSIVCETIQGTKGIERQAIILVNLDAEPNIDLTYIGASRAVAFLAVVGPQQFHAQFQSVKN